MDDLRKIFGMIRDANRKCTGKDVQSAHIRDFYESLIVSFSNLLTDLKQDRQLWSDLIIDKQRGMISYTVAEGITIDAFKIIHPDECALHKGYWCRNANDKKFYIFLNGCVFGGICTEILSEYEQVVKFDEHMNAHSCKPQDTSLYIPRELNPQSDDKRILTNKMQYVPRKEETNEPFTYRIGSAKHLKSDTANMTDADYRLFNDISVHFLLCLTVAGREYKARSC
jgi:hypothetical protein